MIRKELLDSKEVAEWLNMKESTIRKWTHYGFIPHIKIGRCVRFQERDIEKWLQERTVKGRATLAPEIQWQ
jgi:excisionase family DNA binding protein